MDVEGGGGRFQATSCGNCGGERRPGAGFTLDTAASCRSFILPQLLTHSFASHLPCVNVPTDSVVK